VSFPGGVLVVSPTVGLCLAVGALSVPAAAVGLAVLLSIVLICLLAPRVTAMKGERHDPAHHR
jgi:membrane protein implicated in regulation of membrane protease activity